MAKMYKLAGFSLTLFLFSSCSVLKPTKQIDTNQKALVIQEKKIDQTTVDIVKNDKGKQIQTAALAVGVQHSLNQVTNPPVQVVTASALNERVISIVGSPHLDEIKRIKATVDLLNSEIAEERKKGEVMLDARDRVITLLQQEKSELKEKYEEEISDLTDKAMGIAKTADNSQATLNSMSGMFGLNAVFWGIKKFFFSMLTFIIIAGVLFIVLRVLSTISPAGAAAFAIFNMLGSLIINLLKALTPKAIEMSNLTSNDNMNTYKTVLTKIVDVIQSLKEKSLHASSTVPAQAIDYSLSDILQHFEKDMDYSDKKLIKDILVEQKWKK